MMRRLIPLALIALGTGCATYSDYRYADGGYSDGYSEGFASGGDYYYDDSPQYSNSYGAGYYDPYWNSSYYSALWPIWHSYYDPFYNPYFHYGVTFFPRSYLSFGISRWDSWPFYHSYSPYRYSHWDNYYDWNGWGGWNNHYSDYNHSNRDDSRYGNRLGHEYRRGNLPRFGSASNEAERLAHMTGVQNQGGFGGGYPRPAQDQAGAYNNSNRGTMQGAIDGRQTRGFGVPANGGGRYDVTPQQARDFNNNGSSGDAARMSERLYRRDVTPSQNRNGWIGPAPGSSEPRDIDPRHIEPSRQSNNEAVDLNDRFERRRDWSERRDVTPSEAQQERNRADYNRRVYSQPRTYSTPSQTTSNRGNSGYGYAGNADNSAQQRAAEMQQQLQARQLQRQMEQTQRAHSNQSQAQPQTYQSRESMYQNREAMPQRRESIQRYEAPQRTEQPRFQQPRFEAPQPRQEAPRFEPRSEPAPSRSESRSDDGGERARMFDRGDR